MPLLCLLSTVYLFYVWWKELRFLLTPRKRSCEVSPSLKVLVACDGNTESLNQAAMDCTRGSNANKHRLSLIAVFLQRIKLRLGFALFFHPVVARFLPVLFPAYELATASIGDVLLPSTFSSYTPGVHLQSYSISFISTSLRSRLTLWKYYYLFLIRYLPDR